MAAIGDTKIFDINMHSIILIDYLIDNFPGESQGIVMGECVSNPDLSNPRYKYYYELSGIPEDDRQGIFYRWTGELDVSGNPTLQGWKVLRRATASEIAQYRKDSF